MDIQAIGAASRAATLSRIEPPAPVATASEPSGVASFGKVLGGILDQATRTEAQADDLVQRMAKGEPVDIHQVTSALSAADLSFRMVLEVRNKLMDAWQEIHRMPV